MHVWILYGEHPNEQVAIEVAERLKTVYNGNGNVHFLRFPEEYTIHGLFSRLTAKRRTERFVLLEKRARKVRNDFLRHFLLAMIAAEKRYFLHEDDTYKKLMGNEVKDIWKCLKKPLDDKMKATGIDDADLKRFEAAYSPPSIYPKDAVEYYRSLVKYSEGNNILINLHNTPIGFTWNNTVEAMFAERSKYHTEEHLQSIIKRVTKRFDASMDADFREYLDCMDKDWVSPFIVIEIPAVHLKTNETKQFLNVPDIDKEWEYYPFSTHDERELLNTHLEFASPTFAENKTKWLPLGCKFVQELVDEFLKL